jgi:chorismate dehydratase
MTERIGNKTLIEKPQPPESRSTPRLGQISFINNLPIVLPIERALVKIDAHTTYANPAELNASYANGLLDVGAMSSFFYLQQPNFRLVETVSISCVQEVGSVLFFCKNPPGELDGSTVAVPASSATSINLLQVLLLERYGVHVNAVVENRPDLHEQRFDGALVIGDHALHVDAEWSLLFERIDLGQWWHSDFGLPMVFGVWAATGEWYKANADSFDLLSTALQASAQIGLTELFPAVLSCAQERTGLDQQILEKYYLHQLNYEMTGRHLQGLEQYRRLCVKHSLL